VLTLDVDAIARVLGSETVTMMHMPFYKTRVASWIVQVLSLLALLVQNVITSLALLVQKVLSFLAFQVQNVLIFF
jgi:hypothetical protein